MTDTEVVPLMESSRSPAEWDANARAVKAAHAGAYPECWYDLIVASGLADRVRARWGDRGPQIRVTQERGREF